MNLAYIAKINFKFTQNINNINFMILNYTHTI